MIDDEEVANEQIPTTTSTTPKKYDSLIITQRSNNSFEVA
jgi:hypothetical protein